MLDVPAPTAIRMTPAVFTAYKETIAKQPPETFALLGGKLDDYLITDFRFCPPARTALGRRDASRSHVNIDADFLNWIVDREWKPNGRYMLGVWHSHPGNVTRPSLGDPLTNQGDIAFFSACLANDDSPDRNWHTFLAPITTFDDSGHDTIHGWTLRRGDDVARSCPIAIEDPVSPTVRAENALANAEARVVLTRDLLRRYAMEIANVLGDASLDVRMRADMANALARMRDAEIEELLGGRHPLSSLLIPSIRRPHHA